MRADARSRPVRRWGVEEPNNRHRLLRARRERPSCRRAAEERDQRAPFHIPSTSMAKHSCRAKPTTYPMRGNIGR
jgi:hypothetical protein